MERVVNHHYLSGLTGIRTGDDFESSQMTGESSDFCPATDQDLRSMVDKTNLLRKSFQKVINEEFDVNDLKDLDIPELLKGES